MALIKFCAKFLGQTSFSKYFVKKIMEKKLFWTIANIVGYVIMVRWS